MAAWEKSDVISAVSALCAISVFCFGIWQYRSSENWKRSEFVAAQIKEFGADKMNQSVLLMMDYDPAHIELFPDKDTNKDRYVDVHFGMLIAAIEKDGGFTPEEMQIRVYFEHFLRSVSRFDYFLSSGAIEARELCADFGYPVELLTGSVREVKRKNVGIDIAPFSKAMADYLRRWNYTNVSDFMRKIQEECA